MLPRPLTAMRKEESKALLSVYMFCNCPLSIVNITFDKIQYDPVLPEWQSFLFHLTHQGQEHCGQKEKNDIIFPYLRKNTRNLNQISV